METAAGILRLFDDQGEALPVSMNGQSHAASTALQIPPLGSTSFSSTGTGDLQVGSVLVDSSSPLGGVIRFAFPSFGVSGVGQSFRFSALMTPAVRNEQQGLNTGIALRNIMSTGIEIRLSLRGLNGTEVSGGSRTLTMAANGHVAKFVDELFPLAATGQFEGALVVTVATSGEKSLPQPFSWAHLQANLQLSRWSGSIPLLMLES